MQQLTIILQDRRPALLAILRSMLVTYSSLLGSLLEPPNTMSTAGLQPEWQRYVEWITVLSQNLMAAANDLRPMQVCGYLPCRRLTGIPCVDVRFKARVNLEVMMTRQLELRREETKRLHLYVVAHAPKCTSSIRHLTETATRKCDELETKLAELKSSAAHAFSQGDEQVKQKVGGQPRELQLLPEHL